jgi:cytidine deaminase
MKEQKFEFEYEVYNDIAELKPADAELLARARTITQQAYAPYSNFFVGAAAKIKTGDIVTGTNQENASFPVGICAERSLLASAASLFPGQAIDTIAISYDNKNDHTQNDHPISPCGMCRQALQEYEVRGKKPMRLILGGQTGKIIIVNSVSQLLPFAFTPDELKS